MPKMPILWIIFFAAFCHGIEGQNPPKQVGAGRPSREAEKIEPYVINLAAIYEEGDKVQLYLSDGTVWEHIRANPLRLGWLIGDDIIISRTPKEGWRLDNETYKGSVTAKFVRIARELLPVVQSVDNLGAKIVLDNGSEWQIAWWDRQGGLTYTWKPGDRIIISPLELPTQEKSHLLINLDRSMRSANALLLRKNE